MKNMSMRVISAALAACMMTTALPVSALALGGGTEPEIGVSTQAAAVRLAGGETIDDDFIALNGSSYSMSNDYTENGSYAAGITIHTNKDVTITIDGPVGIANGNLFKIEQVGSLTIENNSNYKVETTETAAGHMLMMESTNTGTVTVNGGVYESMKNPGVNVIYEISGTLTLNDATVSNLGSPKTAIYMEECTLVLNKATVSSENSNAIKNNGGTLEIFGGKYTAVKLGVITVENGGKATIHSGTFENTGVGQVFTIIGGTLIIDDDMGETKIINQQGTAGTVANAGALYFKGGTITAPNAAAIGSVDRSTYEGTWITGGTITGCLKGVVVNKEPVYLKDVTFEGNATDIYLAANQTITIDENYTGTATVGCADAAENRQITTEDTEDYQPKWKLVSADDAYIVDYKKDETTGEEYRYLKTRDENSFVVVAENATATAALPEGEKELYSFTQVPAGTEVTLTAAAPDEGWVFTGWQVTKGGVTLEDTATAAFEMPTSDVVVSAQYEYRGTDSTEGASAGGAAAAVVVGAAAAWGVYEAGTGIYRMVNMKGIPMPANRGELALLIWEHAGKPEPASDALYADIDADNTDLQKAAHWAVEQGLMDEKANNNFKPGTYVTKLRTCVTWDKAKQKGLFD